MIAKQQIKLPGLKSSSNPLTFVILLFISLAILAGCTLKPDITLAPEATRPQTVSSIENLPQYTTTDLSAEEVVVDQWWRVIGDAEINTLVDELRVESLTLKETRLQIAQAQELALQARSFRLPSVNGSADVSGNGARTPDSSFDLSDAYGLGISADFDADIFGGLRSAERSALLQSRASELAFLSSEQQEIALLVRNWVAASTLKRQLALAEETAESFRTTFDLTSNRFRAGSTEVSAGDVQIARQNYDSALVDIPDLQTQLNVQLLEIDEQLARLPGETLASFVGAVVPDRDLKLPIGVPADLLANRPDVAAAELSYRAALEDVGAARADLYPALSLSAALTFEGDSLGDVFSADTFITNVIASLTQPIFNGGRLRSEVRLQTAVAEELATVFARTTLAALIDVEQAVAQLVGIDEQLKRLDDNVASAVLSDTITQNRYRRGLGTLLSILESQRTLNAARQNLILTEQAYLNAYIELFLSLGGSWFDPTTDLSNTLNAKGA